MSKHIIFALFTICLLALSTVQVTAKKAKGKDKYGFPDLQDLEDFDRLLQAIDTGDSGETVSLPLDSSSDTNASDNEEISVGEQEVGGSGESGESTGGETEIGTGEEEVTGSGEDEETGSSEEEVEVELEVEEEEEVEETIGNSEEEVEVEIEVEEEVTGEEESGFPIEEINDASDTIIDFGLHLDVKPGNDFHLDLSLDVGKNGTVMHQIKSFGTANATDNFSPDESSDDAAGNTNLRPNGGN